MKHSVDIHVGQRVRQRRRMVGMTMRQLGDKIGIKIPQIQKFETAANRIGASRMWDIAAALDVPVSFFFEGLDGQVPDTGEAWKDILADKEMRQFVSNYFAIPKNQRRRLFEQARVLNDAA